jgi:mannosyltransferase
MNSKIILLGIIILGLVLRSYGLSERSLWFDEAFTWRLIQFPIFEMAERVGRDNHPPLYFILLKGWAQLFGDSAMTLRSFSTVVGVATIFATYLFTAEAFGPFSFSQNEFGQRRRTSIPLFAALLTALSVFQIRYSWEIRMYSLAALLAVLSGWALARALRPGANLGWWGLFGFLSILLVYTHYFGFFSLVAGFVYVLVYTLARGKWNLRSLFRQQVFWYGTITIGAVIIAWLPWLPTFLRQRSQVKDDFWFHPVTFWNVAEMTYQMFVIPDYIRWIPWQQSLLAFVTCLVSFLFLCRSAGPAEWLVLCLGFGPVCLGLLALELDISALAARFFLMAHVFFLIALAALILRFRFHPERASAVSIVLTFFVCVDLDYWQKMDLTNKTGVRGAAEFLAFHRKPGEPVIVCMPFHFFPLLHHASERNDYYLYTSGKAMPHHLGTAAMIPDDLITDEKLKRIASRRVWVVNMGGGFLGHNRVPVPPEWQERQTLNFSDVFDLGDLILLEYENSPAPAILIEKGR